MKDRRKFIIGVSTVGTIAIAGCVEVDNNDDHEPESDNDGNDDGDNDDDDNDNEPSQDGPIVVLEHEAYVTNTGSPAVQGVIENVGDTEYPLVTVQAIFFDGDVQLGTGTDVVDNFGQGRRYEFDAVALGVDPERVETYQMSVDP